MLNKKVCRRCKEVVSLGEKVQWDGLDDLMWNSGAVFCFIGEGVKEVLVRERPPDWCPFATEHVVSTENADASEQVGVPEVLRHQRVKRGRGH